MRMPLTFNAGIRHITQPRDVAVEATQAKVEAYRPVPAPLPPPPTPLPMSQPMDQTSRAAPKPDHTLLHLAVAGAKL